MKSRGKIPPILQAKLKGGTGKIDILGFPVDNVTMEEAVGIIENYIREGTPHHVITVNSLMYLLVIENTDLQRVFAQAHLIVPDSSGVVLAGALLGQHFKERVAGIDLLYKLIESCQKNGYSLFFIGAKPGIAEWAVANLKKRFPALSIAGTHCGYFSAEEEKEMIKTIAQKRPSILLVGLNIPFQELWIARHLKELSVPVCIGVGGSFDVIAGRVKRAPLIMQKLGLEWLWRTIVEPWRVRRIILLPIFIWKVLVYGRRKNSKC